MNYKALICWLNGIYLRWNIINLHCLPQNQFYDKNIPSRQLLFKLLSKRHIIYRLKWWKYPFGPIIVWIHALQSEQDPPVYYSIVILTILYYLRVADLMGITSPYPRENIIAGNYILADMRAYLNKRHRQQNKEILIRHSPGMGECFWFSGIQITEKNFHQERSVIGGRRNKFLREN